ncbi:MAG: hypothetical protein QM702_00165 [Rubrivivax sp.]
MVRSPLKHLRHEGATRSTVAVRCRVKHRSTAADSRKSHAGGPLYAHPACASWFAAAATTGTRPADQIDAAIAYVNAEFAKIADKLATSRASAWIDGRNEPGNQLIGQIVRAA